MSTVRFVNQMPNPGETLSAVTNESLFRIMGLGEDCEEGPIRFMGGFIGKCHVAD